MQSATGNQQLTASLRHSGITKRGVISRGSQSVVYDAIDHNAQDRRVVVKRLYAQHSPYGDVGISPTELREPSLLMYIRRRQEEMKRRVADAESGPAGTESLIDPSARVIELYRVLEAPFDEICLLLEYCEMSLRRVCVTLPPPESSDNDTSEMGSSANITSRLEGLLFSSDSSSQPCTEEEDDATKALMVRAEEEAGPPEGLCRALRVGAEAAVSEHSLTTTTDRVAETPAVPCPVLRELCVLRYLMRRVLRILLFLHEECQICHRDIKPCNILVNKEGELRLTDFGSACFMRPDEAGDSANAVPLPRTPTTFRTTRMYASPECILGQPYDVSMDVWSTGVVFLELLLQRPLFTGSSELAVLSEIYDLLPPSRTQEGKPVDASFDVGTRERLCNKEEETTCCLEALVSPLLSSQGVDFMRGMLDLNPNRRLSAREALRHPFLSFPGWDQEDAEGGKKWREKICRVMEGGYGH